MAPSHPRWPPELVPEVAYHEGGPGPGESMVWGALWDAKILMIVGGGRWDVLVKLSYQKDTYQNTKFANTSAVQ